MTPHSLSDQARVSYEARLRADGPTPALIRAAEPCVAALDDCRDTARRDELRPVEYAVASGVLNVKQQASDAEWSSYVRDTIADLAALGTARVRLNALTLYSDAEKRRPAGDVRLGERELYRRLAQMRGRTPSAISGP